MSLPFEAPDAIEPITAWKALQVADDGSLVSPSIYTWWSPQERMKARCDYRGHEAPDADCSCGIYMVTDRTAALGYAHEGAALVRLRGWGKVIPATRGFRVQYAYPEKIYLLNLDEKMRTLVEEKWGVETERSSFQSMVDYKLPVKEALSINMIFPAFLALVPAIINGAVMFFAGYRLSNLVAMCISILAAIFIFCLHLYIRRI